MAPQTRPEHAGVEQGDGGQQQKTDQGGEHHQDGGVGMPEIALHQIFVDVGGKRPEHRTGKGIEQPHAASEQ